jgi:hypothetical protein
MTERPPLVYSLLCAYVPFSLYGFRHPGVVVVFVVARVLSGLLVIDAPSSKVSRNKIKLPPPAASPLHLASDAGVPPPLPPQIWPAWKHLWISLGGSALWWLF